MYISKWPPARRHLIFRRGVYTKEVPKLSPRHSQHSVISPREMFRAVAPFYPDCKAFRLCWATRVLCECLFSQVTVCVLLPELTQASLCRRGLFIRLGMNCLDAVLARQSQPSQSFAERKDCSVYSVCCLHTPLGSRAISRRVVLRPLSIKIDGDEPDPSAVGSTKDGGDAP